MARILGIDASTTTIGICILNCDDSKPILEHYEFYKPKKKENLFFMLSAVRKYIIELINKHKPDIVVIEDILKFIRGRSTANTITLLAALNRTVGTAVYDSSGKYPKLLTVMKIRHAVKLTKDLPDKDQIPDIMSKRLGIDFPYVYTRKKTIAKESYDIADSIAVAFAYYLINTVNKKRKKV
jgi:Holliday junction resolvasome RuvABC endonuclease subunit